VIAFDIAGFGESPPLPEGTSPNAGNLAEALERSIRALGFEGSIDMAGNSLGGLLALECARRGLARTAIAISPPGLWEAQGAAPVNYLFRLLRFMTTRARGVVRPLVRNAVMRELMLTVPVSVGSRRMPAEDAVRVVDDFGSARVFEATFDSTRSPFAAREISVPVTVAFGGRDWILPGGSRCRHSLPAHTHWIEKPRWGHVPMWVDPAGVAQLIADGSQ
jgi:pimeloyl-ACP methyl ester carboxylesterase